MVDDDHFTIFHDVLDIAPVKGVRLDRGLHVVLEIPVLGIRNIANAEQLLNFFPAFIANGDRLMFFVQHVVAGKLLGLARRHINFLTLLQLGDDAIHAIILVGGFLARA